MNTGMEHRYQDHTGMSRSQEKVFGISVFVALLVHIAGAIGIAFFDRSFFLQLTPVNLLLMFVLLVWNERNRTKAWLVFFLIAFSIGLITEIIGVNTALLFGHYAYGNLLGPKVAGVPLLIGINWFCIVCCSIQTILFLFPSIDQKPLLASLFAATLATLFDWIMEPVAMAMEYWHWQQGTIPVYNYVCWFLIAWLISWLYFRVKPKSANRFARILILVQVIFFLFLRYTLH